MSSDDFHVRGHTLDAAAILYRDRVAFGSRNRATLTPSALPSRSSISTLALFDPVSSKLM
jgi:hypothetical protein